MQQVKSVLKLKKLWIFQVLLILALGQISCNGNTQRNESADNNTETENDNGSMEVETIAEGLEHPWGMDFLPDGRLLLTERAGRLRILDTNNQLSEPLQGAPEFFVSGQGGAQDVALDPNFEQNQMLYLSYAEPRENNASTTAVGRGTLQGNSLQDFEVIFRMEPSIQENKHYGSRLVFTPDGYLMVTLGERFQFDPAQDLSNHFGTIVRINKDGSVPDNNPFVDDPDAKDEIFSYGHRNIESAAIDPQTGNLWVAEMGPQGGDEFNQPQAGENYGWPEVSWGENYDGTQIPDPDTTDEYADAVIVWTPVISPSGMIFYTGDMFPEWQNQAMIGGLTAHGIVQVEVNGNDAEEIDRIDLGTRIRDVAQAPDGSIYALTDESDGKVLRIKKE